MPTSAQTPVQTCRHVKEDGVYCQCPALRGREYCYFHLRTLGRRMKQASDNARRHPHRLLLPPLEDMNAVQVGLMQVLDALAAGTIDHRTAGLMLYGLQQAASNLRSLTAAPALAVAAEPEGRAEDCPDFEAQFQLPVGLDLAMPPEVAFPPPAHAPEDERPWRDRDPAPFGKYQPEDIELEEVRQKQGEHAYERRSAQLQKKEWKKIERVRYERDHARYVVEAHRRNEAMQIYDPERELAERKRVMAQVQAEEQAHAPATPSASYVDPQSFNGGGSEKRPPATVTAGLPKDGQSAACARGKRTGLVSG